MPIVLTQNETSYSGHEYADVFGSEYEYPSLYSSLVVPGTAFVYYRGTRSADGKRGPASYLGRGCIGATRQSPSSNQRLVATITELSVFGEPVYFKPDGIYLESDANQTDFPGLYFQRGVRTITQADFELICRLGEAKADA